MAESSGAGDNRAVMKKRSASLWELAGTIGNIRKTLASQRRQSQQIIEDMVTGFDHVIDGEDNIVASTLNWFEKATMVNRRYLFFSAVVFAIMYLSMGRNAGSLCNILAMTYPIYASIKAAESFPGYQTDRWLHYWIVYSTISLVEVLLEIFLVWLPFYYLIKFLFLAWCMSPTTLNGSCIIYGSIIRPLFKEHNEKVDSALSAVTQKLTEISKTSSKKNAEQQNSRKAQITVLKSDDDYDNEDEHVKVIETVSEA